MNAREPSKAAQDVLAERQRQQEVEGWTTEHDDYHQNQEMAEAAGCYVQAYCFPGQFKPGFPSPSGCLETEGKTLSVLPRFYLLKSNALTGPRTLNTRGGPSEPV